MQAYAAGQRMQNGFVESFNGRLRPSQRTQAFACRATDERLNEHLFDNLPDARRLIGAWRRDYNHERPHSSLDGLTPWAFATRSGDDQNRNSANF